MRSSWLTKICPKSKNKCPLKRQKRKDIEERLLEDGGKRLE